MIEQDETEADWKNNTVTPQSRSPLRSIRAEQIQELQQLRVFRMNRKPLDKTEEVKEDTHYVNVAAPPEEIKETPVYADVAAPPDRRCLFFTQCFPPIAVCWLILLVIMGLRIYFTTVISDNNAKLNAEIQQLELLRNNLTAQIQEMTDVSRAQWTIDAYCPRENNKRQCKACETGWLHTQSNCHNINAAVWKTWEEARKDCRGKKSDLVVMDDEAEKDLISHYNSPAIDGYWVGLRAEDGKWRWINGSDLAESSWIVAATDGQCAVSAWTNLLSVSCGSRRRWLCKKKALSV